MQTLTTELRSLDEELRDSASLDLPDRYQAHRPALVELRGKAADATHLVGMTDETRDAYNEVVGSVRFRLEPFPDVRKDLETILAPR
ncbi:MAG: hypothetical protein IAG13_23915 [Deltaproteobacteria bacterium]|nr:hypothetical protein [Nannocystaceae bacterium]